MSRRLTIIWDYDSDETGFILVEATVIARSLSYQELKEQKRLIELEAASK